MSSSSQRVLAVVRRQILNGERVPGEKITEVGIAAEMDVSRTPTRTALATLAAEGLIEKRSGRGFTVRSISSSDVEKSIAVRAALEALAARTMAENGMPKSAEDALLKSIAFTERVLDADEPDPDYMDGYQEANILFHETIMYQCGNDLIAHAYERIAMLPLAALGSLAFDRTNPRRELKRLTVGHSQHIIIFDAIKKRDAARAEAMMREHSHATLNYADLFVKRIYETSSADRLEAAANE
ncbi:GntR family transcriptional regulator [Nitratireductor sp. XY-223]|uniref:GntR family transcriptional regulator n=1 Tax=Nitratireductor sp. XY-223 TaxID=2561926 RepID=UPI0010AA4E7F|nr:GntR family transcriptional regulator [Nitratireductor sp. XY-223]